MNNRYYHPRLGHFLTPDFRAPDIYDPSTFTEPYAYARGNPVMFLDLDGLKDDFFDTNVAIGVFRSFGKVIIGATFQFFYEGTANVIYTTTGSTAHKELAMRFRAKAEMLTELYQDDILLDTIKDDFLSRPERIVGLYEDGQSAASGELLGQTFAELGLVAEAGANITTGWEDSHNRSLHGYSRRFYHNSTRNSDSYDGTMGLKSPCCQSIINELQF